MYTQVYVRPYSSLRSAVVRPSLFSPYRWVSPSLFDFWAGQLNPLWTLREPVARHGSFVMNTRQELMQAFVDYQEGRF